MGGASHGQAPRAGAEGPSIEHTPTWVVAAICFAIVFLSLAAERFLHSLGKSLKHKKQKALYSALERLKEELMLLGFISFLLSLSQGFIAHICIPKTAADFMLPCKKDEQEDAEEVGGYCRKGYVPLLSLEALHHLHIFIFVLGLVHVVFCVTTIFLGAAKMRKWKLWEAGIQQDIPKLDQRKPAGQQTPLHVVLRHNHLGEFIKERTKGFWMKLAVVSWIVAFFKQFHDSVSKSDYKALRSAFILIHCEGHPKFDFYKYMIRALEHDFKRVVGISWYLWLFVILFLLLNINGWHTYFWLAFLPLFLLLVVGAKLEHIITRFAQEAASLSEETMGVPNIVLSKDYFWFGKPEIVLHLIHFILFQNSFEIAFFFWVMVTYGFKSCIMEQKAYSISRLVIGLIIEVLCSYITLPLYAIVTHMSGDLKLQGIKSGLHESVAEWYSDVQRGMSHRDDPSGGAAEPHDVAVAPAPAGERFGSMVLAPAPAPPDLDEIVSAVDVPVVVVDDDSHRR